MKTVPQEAAQAAAEAETRRGAQAENEARRVGQELREWVERKGGYVHPSLTLTLATPHGR